MTDHTIREHAVSESCVPRSEVSTMSFIRLLHNDPALKEMVVKSLAKAAEINPDFDTNPVRTLEQLYQFMDWAVKCMPWAVLAKAKYPSLYDHIDQSLNYIWFLFDQPLEELEPYGYYYPCLEYHEPVKSWLKEYSKTWGAFLSSPQSWNDNYWKRSYEDKRFGMTHGWYGHENIWTSYNDFFSRRLIDPSVRPIAAAPVVSPADSHPLGLWKIGEDGQILTGVQVKSRMFTNVDALLGPDSQYHGCFNGGTLTHTFLDVCDYHRYHFPVDGKVLEVTKIDAGNGVGGRVAYDHGLKRYILLDREPDWQSQETRDCVILETEFGLAAVLPVGMSQVCSCNFEETVVPGAVVKKGDPMGYFLFGGSDIVMIFQKGVQFRLACWKHPAPNHHLFMGQAYLYFE